MTTKYKEKANEVVKMLTQTMGIDVQLCCATGSRAYGMANESSDYDFIVVRANTPKEILTCTQTTPVHRIIGDIDLTIYPFNNFIKLLSKQNPNLLEIFGLKSDDFFLITDNMKQILNSANLFLSKKCASSYRGYAQSCYIDAKKLYMKSKEIHPTHFRKKAAKSMFECLRIYEQGTELFKTGKIRACVTDPEMAYTLMKVRAGEFLDNNLDPVNFHYENTMFHTFENCFDNAFKSTNLPDEPDYNAIEKLQMGFNQQIVLNYNL